MLTPRSTISCSTAWNWCSKSWFALVHHLHVAENAEAGPYFGQCRCPVGYVVGQGGGLLHRPKILVEKAVFGMVYRKLVFGTESNKVHSYKRK